MSVLTEFSARSEDVGDILLKVQEDLQHLKDKLLNDGQSRELDLSALENAITVTEQGIKSQTETVLSQINNRVQTLPSLDSPAKQDEPYVTVETTWDMKARPGGESFGARKMTDFRTSDVRDVSGKRHLLSGPHSGGKPVMQMKGYSPGQQHTLDYQTNVTANPQNAQTRQVVNDNYGIQLPLIHTRQSHQLPGKVVTGSTIEPLAALPAANRKDASLPPPPISEEEARFGILSLLQRGLIPPAAQLTLEPSPVSNKLVPLYNVEEKFRSPSLTDVVNEPVFKLDNTIIVTQSEHQKKLAKSRQEGKVSRKSTAKSRVASKQFQLPYQPLPPPTTPATGDISRSVQHRFAIQHGKTRDQSSEFLTFKQHYCLHWGSIVTMLQHFEKLLTNYSIPVAFINGDVMADLALDYELDRHPPLHAMFTAIMNRDDVESLIFRPGRRYLGPEGRDLAAAKIQATWKCYQSRSIYLEHRQKKWAAGVIAITWIMHVKMAMVRKGLKQTRADELAAFKERSKKLALQWNRIKNSKRVIIHVPSLGHSQILRDRVHELGVRQNTQMARLCDLQDPNVDIIYVSPVPVNDETLQYYSKLLSLKAAIDSGNVDDQSNAITDRFKIVVPEAINSFPTHRMCLATHLKYSPRALRRIKNLIKGRDAYIVSGQPHVDDLSVAQALSVPLLGTEPEVAHLYSTKSGSKRIFASAGVAVPFGEYDIYNLSQLHECFAQLITDHLDVKVWLFKLDDEFDGKGITSVNVSQHLPSYKWACKECQRYGEKWSRKWAQEPAYIKIYSEIAELLDKHAEPIHKADYPTWRDFLRQFLALGGVIEATPPSDSMTALSANMFIEPNGKINILGIGDQIHADSPYKCWGLSVPQSSVEPEQLNNACLKVAEACKSRGVTGYFVIDFVTFIDMDSEEQVLWATDLNLCYDDSHSMLQLMNFVTNGCLDVSNHMYDIPAPKQKERKRRRKREELEEVHDRHSDSIPRRKTVSLYTKIKPDDNLSPTNLRHIPSPRRVHSFVGRVPIAAQNEALRSFNSTILEDPPFFQLTLFEQRLAGSLNEKDIIEAFHKAFPDIKSDTTFRDVAYGSLNVFGIVQTRQLIIRRLKNNHINPPGLNRYAVFSTKLLHTNLAIVHYSVFFQMCRAHGIGYDVKEKQGSIFTLIDSGKRENIGMLTISDNLQGALAGFARNLSVIHQEISAPNMQGKTNFKLVIQDIEGILGTTIQNAEEQELETEEQVDH